METFLKSFDKEDNTILVVAAFIADKGSVGATYIELVEFFYEKKYITNDEYIKLIEHLKEGKGLFELDENNKFKKALRFYSIDDTFVHNKDGISILFSGLSSLIDFIELKHARKNSLSAQKFSIAAIIISLLSLIIGYIQIKNNSIKIDDTQIENIKSIYKNDNDYIKESLNNINNKLK